MGSSQFNKTQYEEERKKDYNSQQESIRRGIRAVLTMYMARERDHRNVLDVLVHDRISEWRTMERVAKFATFKKFFFISMFFVALGGAYGIFEVFKYKVLVYVSIGIYAFSAQFFKVIFITGQVSKKYPFQKRAVKRAIRDVWFETVISVQLAYYVFLAIILLVWGLANANDHVLDIVVYTIYWLEELCIYLLFLDGLEATNPVELMNIFFLANSIFIISDFMFWKLVYGTVPLLPFEEEDESELHEDADLTLEEDEDELLQNNKLHKSDVKKFIKHVSKGDE
jgi:hypothetical protein